MFKVERPETRRLRSSANTKKRRDVVRHTASHPATAKNPSVSQPGFEPNSTSFRPRPHGQYRRAERGPAFCEPVVIKYYVARSSPPQSIHWRFSYLRQDGSTQKGEDGQVLRSLCLPRSRMRRGKRMRDGLPVRKCQGCRGPRGCRSLHTGCRGSVKRQSRPPPGTLCAGNSLRSRPGELRCELRVVARRSADTSDPGT